MSDCDFFIAPYNTTPQLAQFFKEELVNVIFGSPKLLSFKHIAQAIVDFDIQKGTFTFVDRNDLKLEKECETIADYFVLAGGMYGVQIPVANKGKVASSELIKLMKETPNLLKPTDKKKEKFDTLKHILRAAPVLNSKRELFILDESADKTFVEKIFGKCKHLLTLNRFEVQQRHLFLHVSRFVGCTHA